MHNYYNELNKIIELTKNNNNLISNLENNINLKEIIREIQKNISIFFDKNDAHFFFNIIYYEENSNEPLIKLINEIDNTYVYNIIFNIYNNNLQEYIKEYLENNKSEFDTYYGSIVISSLNSQNIFLIAYVIDNNEANDANDANDANEANGANLDVKNNQISENINEYYTNTDNINSNNYHNINDIRNETREIIRYNKPIEDKLNVIIVMSNPCNFRRRVQLAQEFIIRMQCEKYVELYIVELAYDCNPKFEITEANNKNHLQLRTEIPLWHKENMINIGVWKLLPPEWKAFAWIDADVEFENETWALDTLKLLNGYKDIIQLFSHCVDMDRNELTMSVFNSFGYQYTKKNDYCAKGINYWHPGYAWACTREAYLKLHGLYQFGILGSGDHNMALSILGMGLKSINENVSDNYKKTIINFQKRAKNIKIGYNPCVIRHHFHGSKKNRKYVERWKLLVEHKYDPINHVICNDNGIIVPTDKFPKKLIEEIFNYFKVRNEDEI